MIETLIAHRETLQKMAVTTRDIDQEQFSPGLRITLGIYAMILDDGLSVLNSIIDHLERMTNGNMDKNPERDTTRSCE